jgi:spoIIIJ-associated protein
MSDAPLVVEATGETVGEAKWAALRELERQAPGLDKAAVRFEVLSEGERGLLGVGYAPARVLAQLPADAIGPAREPEGTRAGESELAADVRVLVERLASAVGVDARVGVREDEDTVTATASGHELGMLIGRHGQTIDAIQYLLNAVVYHRPEEDRKEVVVDAAGYRARRRATLETLAVRSAERAVRSGDSVALDPMTAVERKVVHVRLKEFDGVETSSEGTEPNRYVVIHPVA